MLQYNATRALRLLTNQVYKHTPRICNTCRSSTTTTVYTNASQYYVIRTLPVLFMLPANKRARRNCTFL